MAGQLLSFSSGEAYSKGSALKTMMQIIAATNVRVRVKEIAVSFKGTVSTDPPVKVTVMRQTTAGTPNTGYTPAGRKWNSSNGETVQTTAQCSSAAAATAWTAEPTAGDILREMEVHPMGRHGFVFPEGLFIPGGGRLAVCVTEPAAGEHQLIAEVICEE